MWRVVLHSLLDSLKTTPFLLAIYLLIEFLEGNTTAKSKAVKLLNGKSAPVVAGGMGIIPQCGFSVMATDLYNKSFIKTGTLIAFFVATSDEALPILWSSANTFGVAWVVVAIKVVYAVALGYLINLADKRNLVESVQEVDSQGCCNHHIHEHKSVWNFVKHPLLHTLKIFLYIFVINTIFALLLHYFGDKITTFVDGMGVFQAFILSAIGLIPNCASSVIVTSMFTEGIIALPAMVSGLVANSGIAIAILFKDKTNLKRNLVIVGIMYLSAVFIGVAIHLFMLLF